MAQLNAQEFGARVAAAAQAMGLKVHEEQIQGESMLRIEVGKTFAKSPRDLFQGVGAHVLVNLPGNSDAAVAAGLAFVGMGNSSDSSPPSAP